MADDYHLICMDCRVTLYVGKVYWRDEDGMDLGEITFDGVFDYTERKWHKRDEYFGKVIEKFLIIHRNHELRFVPEGVDELLEDSLGCVPDVEANQVLDTEFDFEEIDAEKELEEWRKKLGK